MFTRTASPIATLWGLLILPKHRESPALDMVTERLRYLERDAAEAHKQSLRVADQLE